MLVIRYSVEISQRGLEPPPDVLGRIVSTIRRQCWNEIHRRSVLDGDYNSNAERSTSSPMPEPAANPLNVHFARIRVERFSQRQAVEALADYRSTTIPVA